jgi:hypothetical protein|tara:strand:+ start:386 stop:550 length:165 start_codon:yes stop_codon:yes gene_type:complete
MTPKKYKQMMSYLTRSENPNLVKNMSFVKRDQIPPVKGPNSKGLKFTGKQVKKG